MPSPLLDNAVWHSLQLAHADLGERRGGAVRFAEDVAIFGAVPDRPTSSDWADLAGLVGPGGFATLFRGEVHEPDGWARARTIPALQMVAVDVRGEVDEDAVDLGPSHADEMVELAERTKPGPFGRRTVELGGYVGLRDADGALVAMAGHRLRLPGLVEISAVCTDASRRGSGLATRLVRHVVAAASAAGDSVFLHVMTENVGAIRLYEALGFETLRTVEAVALVAPTASGAPATVPLDGQVAIDACSVDD